MIPAMTGSALPTRPLGRSGLAPMGEQRRDRERRNGERPDDYGAGWQVEHGREQQADQIADEPDRVAGRERVLAQRARRERGHHEAREHEVDADELHGRGHADREQHVESGTPEGTHHEPPAREDDGCKHGSRHERVPVDEQNLPDEQVAELLAAVRVVREQ